MAGDSNGIEAVIRNYAPGDLQACRGLWVDLTEWHRRIYDSPEIGGADPGRQFDEHLARVGPENLWVAEAMGKVMGLAGLIPEETEGELEPIVVSDRFRGHGVGGRLVDVVIAAARARGLRQLKVRPVARNALAIRFFHSSGFDVLGHIELFVDLGPSDRQIWKGGESIAGCTFRL